MMSRHKKVIIWAVSLLAVSLLLLGMVVWQDYRHQELVVTFFDIGQGDSLLIQTPSHQSILIDGGPDSGVLNKLGRTLPFYDHTIDLMILTHAHSDHLVGLVEVVRRYGVRHILYNGVTTSGADFIAWQDSIKGKNIPVTMARAGEVFQFGEVSLTVLCPFKDVSQENFKDLNDSSVVTRLVYQDISFLFTGDAPVAVEEQLLQHPADLKSDVLKVGHHGSRYSSSEEFLKAVSPQYAVISVGENKFGHPQGAVINRLKQLGIEWFRTDRVGDIEITTNGHLMTID
jgi:competence protein ComEC